MSFVPRVSRTAPHLAPMSNEEALKAMCDLLADFYIALQHRNFETGPIHFACFLSTAESGGVRLATGDMMGTT